MSNTRVVIVAWRQEPYPMDRRPLRASTYCCCSQKELDTKVSEALVLAGNRDAALHIVEFAEFLENPKHHLRDAMKLLVGG